MNGNRVFSPERIADVLRERIRAGDLKAGHRMPTQAELMNEFGVDRGIVRQAMKLLEADGLLSNVRRGSPPMVVESVLAPASGEPQPTMAALAPHLVRAFEEPRVRIDVFSLTGETLMVALSEPLIRVHRGEFAPESIDVRVMLPPADMEMLYPAPFGGWRTDEAMDALIRRRTKRQRDAQVAVMVNSFRKLPTAKKASVRVSFREVATTPVEKLYLLNGKELLMGSYLFKRNTVEDSEQLVELRDVGGAEAPLFHFTSAGGGRDAAWVADKQRWFDALWENIATDLVAWPRDHGAI
ncbi:GntR family transcriptional regulator [Streptomyces sp. NPDC057696]|uniref:GntR family transcriptional regulator n=1 Tax=Streptomyces sp. NPDC057696 TaxID=3346218 RepID=UPI00367A196E